jgi:general secretion pathway protein D
MPSHLPLACVALLLAAALGGCEGRQWAERPWQRTAPVLPTTAPLPDEAMEPDLEPLQPIPLAPEAAPAPLLEPVVERGSGRFVAPPPGRPSRVSIVRDPNGEVTLNVVDADLREVVRLVLEDTLGINYVIDPLVGGTITVQTSRPVGPDELIATLDAVLRLNGAALVQAGDLFKVVPIDQALTSGPMPEVRPVPDAGRAGFTVQVVPLRYVAANEIAELLAPFAPPGGVVQVDPVRNLLLLAGSADQLATLSDLAAMFDVDRFEGMSFGLFPLTVASAEALAGELQQVFAAGDEAVAPGVVRILPIERLNALLVMTTQPAYLDRARTWISRLDRIGDGDEPQVFVYPVQNGRAADLAEVLSQLFDLEAGAVGAPDLLAPGLQPAQIRTSGFGPEGEGLGLGADEAPERPASARPRAALAPAAPTVFGAAPANGPRAIRIIADQATNSLVIRATPQEYRKIEAALRQLDILPLQVLIEATIAEVTLTDELRYGVEWFFRFGTQELTLSSIDTGVVAPQFPGFSAVFAGGDSVRVVLSALEAVSDVNVVASPQLLVLDNQTAELQVGDEVPVVTRTAQDTTDDARLVATIEQRQTGVILGVTPRVNPGGLVILEIQQEVSDVVITTTSGIDSPTISQRRIASTVAIQSGETVALGGLIQDNATRDRAGVPLLSGLPGVGWLFGRTALRDTRTELLVLLTPRVVRNPMQARRVTDELRQRLQSLISIEERIN